MKRENMMRLVTMAGRWLGLAGLALWLAGCVLQAEPPLFAEEQGAAALKGLGTQFANYSLRNGAWEKEDEVMEMRPVEQHYEAVTPTGSTSLLFVPMEEDWFVVQGSEPGKPAAYLLAERQDKTVFLYPLMCTELKKIADVAAHIRFEGDDCIAGKDFSQADFAAISASLPDPTMKMEPVAP